MIRWNESSLAAGSWRGVYWWSSFLVTNCNHRVPSSWSIVLLRSVGYRVPVSRDANIYICACVENIQLDLLVINQLAMMHLLGVDGRKSITMIRKT